MKKWLLAGLYLLTLLNFSNTLEGALAGGRPNAISGGKNAFAGLINPANAAWVEDRFDIGVIFFHQTSNFNNKGQNPRLPPGKTNTSYKINDFGYLDAAINKKFKLPIFGETIEGAVALASYTTPPYIRVRTKRAIPFSGTTPIKREEGVHVYSAIFSLKPHPKHSVGVSLDLYHFLHNRSGFQNSANPIRSIAPNHVTNKGRDHSEGLGIGIGWRWKISDNLDFGAVWTRKTYCGSFRRYRGYEPQRAINYQPQTFGAGVTYKFTESLLGRAEALWVDLGNTPLRNDVTLSNGQLNLNKRGSNKSPAPALRDITVLSFGLGYRFNPNFSVGIGASHRLKPSPRPSQIEAHIYTSQTVQNVGSIGIDYKYNKHEVFLGFAHGFKNPISGTINPALGGGKVTVVRVFNVLTFSYGYLF